MTNKRLYGFHAEKCDYWYIDGTMVSCDDRVQWKFMHLVKVFFDGFFSVKKEIRHERNHVHNRRKWKWMQFFVWFAWIFRQLRPLRAIISLNTVHTLFITIQLELFRQSTQCNNISFKIPYLRVWYFKRCSLSLSISLVQKKMQRFFSVAFLFFVMEMHAKIIWLT